MKTGKNLRSRKQNKKQEPEHIKGYAPVLGLCVLFFQRIQFCPQLLDLGVPFCEGGFVILFILFMF